MKKYLVRVAEHIYHDYEVTADSRDDAYDKWCSFTDRQLRELDLGDGRGEWDTPWDIEEINEGEK